MSTVPPPIQPATKVYLIDGDMPWRSVFQLTWKFSIASLVIWTMLALPILLFADALHSWREAGRKAETQQQIEDAQSRLFGT